jgi:hypothetical protein
VDYRKYYDHRQVGHDHHRPSHVSLCLTCLLVTRHAPLGHLLRSTSSWNSADPMPLHHIKCVQDRQSAFTLHIAVEKCNPRMVRALLRHKDIDVTVLNNGGNHPIWAPTNNEASAHAKTLNWVRMFAPCAGQIKCSKTSIWFLYPPTIMHLD